MKKFTLALFSVLMLSKTVNSQANFQVIAPEFDGGSWSSLVAPNGSASTAYHRACYLVPQSELSRLALTNSVITAFGFDYYRPASVATTGQFTVYLENTADVNYTKGLVFSNIITNMSTNFTGSMTVPAGSQNATATVNMPLTTPFTYTGGGIYVAFEWVSASPNATVPARYLANTTFTSNMGGYDFATSAGSTPTAIVMSNFVPVMKFTAGNTATNDMSIYKIEAPGSVSKLTGGHDIIAKVRNNSANTLSSVVFSLSVSGANTFNGTQTLSSVAAGATANVVFNGFVPTTNGLNNMTITAAADQYSVNNEFSWTQTVNCNDYGNDPPFSAITFTDGSYGYANNAILATKFIPANTTSITGIKFVPGTGTQAGNSMCGVLLSSTGNIIAMTNTINLAASNISAFTTFTFSVPEELLAGTTYYYGMAQLCTGCFPFGTSEVPFTYNPDLYFTVPIGGGSIGQAQNHMGYVGIRAILSNADTYITAFADREVLCNNKAPVTFPETTTLNVVGTTGKTYTWTSVPNSNSASIVVSPSVTAAQGVRVYSVTATDISTGCRTNVAAVTVSLSNCNGIPDNSSFATNVQLYPNPSVGGKTKIIGLDGVNKLTLINILGQTVLETEISSDEFELNMDNLKSGNYIIKLSNSNGQYKTLNVINQL